MQTMLELGGITIEVALKDIKHIHLSVYPPTGRVRITAPLRMDMDTIRVYALSRLAWIKQQQSKFHEQERETPREYIERESHYVWGTRYLLELIERDETPSVELTHHHLVLRARPGSDVQRKQAILEDWYRGQVREVVQPLIEKWEKLMGVKVQRVFVQRMKTRWGSCNPLARHIRFNTELAKKPRSCLEYIVVHEMVHLLEPSHNARFATLMDQYLPHWRQLRDELNRAPLGNVHWEY
jgi:predicted metal-dependent hydrolase